MHTPARTRVVVALLLTALSVGCGRRVELISAVPASEANEVMAVLQNAGLETEKISGKDGLASVAIPSNDVGRAVDLLREKGLPRERFSGMGQVFKKEGLISSPLEERARYLYALSQELGATLSQIDGVIVARVHVVLPEKSTVGEPAVPSSAAVFIKHQEGQNMDAVQPLVRRLVSHSIPGLTAEKVSIVLVSASPSRGKTESASGLGSSWALLVVLSVLAAAGLGGSGVLLWKYWWPTYRRRGAAMTGA